MTRAAIYCRVSREHQELEGSSLDTQEARCRSYADERGYHVTGVYRDTFTGAQYRDRPGLTVMRDEVRAGNIDAVICYAVDRLSRNQAHLYIVAEEIDDHGARLEFVTEDFEDSAVGRFIRSARAFAAEVEREKTTERTTRGRRARVESGKLIPNGYPLYGYQWADAEKTRLEFNPVTSRVVRRIYDECLSGMSLRKISEGLHRDGIPSPSGRELWHLTSVSRILRHPNYTGTAYGWWGRTPSGTVRYDTDAAILLPDGTVPPLVTHEEWQAAQQRMAQNKAFAARNNNNPEAALLRGGFVRCGYCSGVMVANINHGSGPRYQCNYRSMRPESQHKGVTIAVHMLDTAVWERLTAWLLGPELVATEQATMSDTDDLDTLVASVDAALSEIDRRTRNLAQAIALADDVTPLIAEMNQANERRRQLTAERDALHNRIGSQSAAESQHRDMREWCTRVATNVERLSYQGRRDVLSLLNLSVKVFGARDNPRFVATIDTGLHGPIVLR